MTARIHFSKVAVIGVGLIGCSLAMVLKEKGLADTITGIGRTLENLETARRLGAVDAITQDVAEGVRGADLVVVAVPVLKVSEVIKKAAAQLAPGSIITDVGSVKEAIIREVEPNLPDGVRFVPGHPIAGTEHSGASAAFSGLFRDHVCILTPTEKTDQQALETVRALWEEAGSRVISMNPRTHDRILSAVSHLPHMIAYTLVNTVADAGAKDNETLGFSAGGFKDFTRIASSSPEMWTDICAANAGPIVEMIDEFQRRLEALKKLIKANDLDGLKEEFERAKKLRDSLAINIKDA
jgi:prephenate dehydrogenase